MLQVICAVCSRATFPTQVTFLMCDGCRLSYCALCTEIVLDKKEVGHYFLPSSSAGLISFENPHA